MLKPAQGCAPSATLGKPAPSSHNPERVASITIAQCDEIERLVNCTIRELIFALHHCEENQLDDAGNCLMTIGTNHARIEEILLAAMKEAA